MSAIEAFEAASVGSDACALIAVAVVAVVVAVTAADIDLEVVVALFDWDGVGSEVTGDVGCAVGYVAIHDVLAAAVGYAEFEVIASAGLAGYAAPVETAWAVGVHVVTSSVVGIDDVVSAVTASAAVFAGSASVPTEDGAAAGFGSS